MANDPKVKTYDSGSWASYTQSSGGTSGDIRRSAAQLNKQVAGEIKIFSKASLINGGMYIPKDNKKP